MTTVLLYIAGVLFVAFGIGISIALHEVGHLVPAKKFGVRVTQYMVGFGPTIWSRQRGETEYGIKAIPLGGYIRMIGMFPPRPGDEPGMVRASSTGRFSQLADEARTASMEEIRPGDEDRVFYKLPTVKKVIIMLGGPLMNLVIATVVLGGIVMIHGQVVSKPGAQVAAVSLCVVPSAEAGNVAPQTAADCPDDQRTPAVVAGLRPGDKVMAIDGKELEDNRELTALVRPSTGKTLQFTVEREGQTLTLPVTPVQNLMQRVDEDGTPVVDDEGKAVTDTVGFIGVSTQQVSALERQPITAVPGIVGGGVAKTAGIVLRLPEKLAGVAEAAFSSGERDPESPQSVVGVGRMAGEVASGQTFLGADASDKLVLLFSIMASLNIALFVFNLIPLLPLDGGHVAGALWESVKRGTAKALGRPDPGHVDVAKALPVAYAVSLAMIAMFVLLAYADIVNPVRLG